MMGKDEFVQHAKEFVDHCFTEFGGVKPMTVIHTAKAPGGMVAMLGDFPNADAKQLYADAIRKLCHKYDAHAVCFVSEAWKRVVEKDEELDVEALMERGVANDPLRVEIVQVLIEHFEARGPLVFEREIARQVPGDDTTPGHLIGEWTEMPADARYAGRFVNLLPGSGGN